MRSAYGTLGLMSFYGLSFALRPWRVASVAFNALRGKETRKLETFLVELKRKTWIAVKGRFGKGSRSRAPVGDAGIAAAGK